ncbi:MAG: glutamate-5-semialdehyde dehydrogenase [Robiginitomaculum sp.]
MTDQSPITDLAAYMDGLGRKAREAANILRTASAPAKDHAFKAMAANIRGGADIILKANALDMEQAKAKGLSAAMLDRLLLDAGRVEAMAGAIESIAALPDPVGMEDTRWTPDNGLTIAKVRVPIGVIGIIYESRPNVTADAGALCLKSGNACILRAGSESANSSKAIHAALRTGLEAAGLPQAAIQLIATTDRAAVGHLLSGLGNRVDLIIPRGGKSLIARVQADARVPVLAHLEGLCHSYVHEDAEAQMATDIVLNAKMRRTGVCGATETLIMDAKIAKTLLAPLSAALIDLGCQVRGDGRARAIAPNINAASEDDWSTEYLEAIISVKIVDNIEGALAHIARYSSGHTDAIITGNQTVADLFLSHVDSAIVMHNTSTQFADGGEFGFGAEIGIATGRIHARGPVGAQHLTTYKYAVHGKGQTRP